MEKRSSWQAALEGKGMKVNTESPKSWLYSADIDNTVKIFNQDFGLPAFT